LAALPVWWELIRISMRAMMAYRLGMLIWPISLMVQLYLLRVVWEAVYGGRESVGGVTDRTLLVFLTISAIHRLFIPTGIAYEIQERVTTGRVANDLVRPVGFLSQMVATTTGFVFGRAPLLVVVIPAVLLVGSLDVPTPENLPLYAVSLVLGYVVNMLIWMLVGMLAFWMMSSNGVRALLGIASDFLAGTLVPLWFMPDALRTALQLLPFQAGAFLPASIFAGQVTGADVLRPFLVQGVWIVVLVGLVRIVWARAQRKIVVQGG
jgi:ABC-type uncharacterized transport system permease subunit